MRRLRSPDGALRWAIKTRPAKGLEILLSYEKGDSIRGDVPPAWLAHIFGGNLYTGEAIGDRHMASKGLSVADFSTESGLVDLESLMLRASGN